MDSLFHFIFAFIGGLGIGLHKKHGFTLLAFVALSAVIIDVDHFISVGIFHNIFITILLPLIIFYMAYQYEKDKGSTKYQTFAILLLIMLTGHLVADLFYGDFIRPFYPINNFSVQLDSSYLSISKGTIVSGDGIAVTFYAAIILLGHFTEHIIERMQKRHQKFKTALKQASREI